MSQLTRFLRNVLKGGRRKSSSASGNQTVGAPAYAAAVSPVPADEAIDSGSSYWERRKDLLYAQHVEKLVRITEPGARSAIDIGAWKTPVIEAFDWIPQRVALDILTPYSSANVSGIKADFFQYSSTVTYDLVLCLQVLEHLEEPKAFAEKLFATGRNVVISVPYMWPKGACRYHCQDPVDGDKLYAWTGRLPIYSIVISEGRLPCSDRLIAYYRAEPLSQAEMSSLESDRDLSRHEATREVPDGNT